MASDKFDYSKLLGTQKIPERKTNARIRGLLKTENPRDKIPEFSNYYFEVKESVPERAEVMKNILYMGELYDLHFVPKALDLPVLYFVAKY